MSVIAARRKTCFSRKPEGASGSRMPPDRTEAIVHLQSPSQAKIALFRSFFRGRDDVYARRFQSRKTGKSGYAPACGNEWVRGVCEKPRIRCADCSHQRFLPVTDDVIRWHLSGHDDAGQPFVAGVYPMLRDEACFFLAADFDKTGWRDDVAAFADTCHRLNLAVAIERSRSGQGGHVWLFFDEAIPAALARRLGSYLLTETMERRPEAGLDSYDRFFPSQDTLPHGGFGNLIALPLQKQAREQGNSVFLDEALVPYADQWAFLSTVRKIGRSRVEVIVRDAEQRGQVVGVRFPPVDEDGEEPWSALPSRRRKPLTIADLPGTLDMVLSDQIYIAKDAMVPALRNRVLRLAAFQNPEFYKAQAMRLPTYDKPRIVACAEDHPHHIALPRGCLDDLLELLADLKIIPVVKDERFRGQPLTAMFRGELRPEQRIATEAMLAHDTGVLSATTAFGKTVIAAWLIAQRGVNALILVHRRQLLDQWIERLASFLDLPPKGIGQIGGGRDRPTGLLDVALIQSLGRKGVVDDRVGEYGHLIVDECHHLPAYSFRAGGPACEGSLRHRLVRHRCAEGRPSPDHLHAVWPSPPPGECEGAGHRAAVRAQGVRSSYCIPFERRIRVGSARGIPEPLSAAHRRRDAQPAHLRGRRRCGTRGPVTSRADGAQRPSGSPREPALWKCSPSTGASGRNGQEATPGGQRSNERDSSG